MAVLKIYTFKNSFFYGDSNLPKRIPPKIMIKNFQISYKKAHIHHHRNKLALKSDY